MLIDPVSHAFLYASLFAFVYFLCAFLFAFPTFAFLCAFLCAFFLCFYVCFVLTKIKLHSFLVADTQLYKRLCPSVGPSVRPSVRNAFFQDLLNALYMIGNDRELNEYRHRALGRSRIIPISKIICPISEKIRWTHLCSDWNMFHQLRSVCRSVGVV